MKSFNLLTFYVFSLIGVAPFLNHFYPGSHRILIWGLGTIVAGLIFAKESVRLKSLPQEYLLYVSLLGFALLSVYKIVDFDGFFRYYQVLIANSIIMIVVYLGIKSFGDLKRIIEVLYMCISAVVLYSYFLEADNSYSADTYERLEGITGNSNGTASYARTSILLGLCIINWTKSKIKKIVLFGAILFCSYVILLTASRTSFGILLMIIFCYIYIKYLKRVSLITYSVILFLVVSSIFTFFVTFLQDFYIYERLTRNEARSYSDLQEEEGRLELFSLAFKAVVDSPLTGVGLNQFKFISGGMISHSDVIDIASQMGLFAAFFYMSIYFRIWKRFRFYLAKNKEDIVLRVLLILFLTEIIFGLTNPNWFSQPSMIVLSLLITYLQKIIHLDLHVKN